jgi:hypothetical protein
MPELWVGIIFEERVMESTAAASWLCVVPGMFGTCFKNQHRHHLTNCALLIGAQFLVKNVDRRPGGQDAARENSLHAPLGRESKERSTNSAGLCLALCQH